MINFYSVVVEMAPLESWYFKLRFVSHNSLIAYSDTCYQLSVHLQVHCCIASAVEIFLRRFITSIVCVQFIFVFDRAKTSMLCLWYWQYDS